jgi:quercetin dioxygenase-like cupin family protein
MKTLTTVVRESGEGERSWFCGGGLMTWKATNEETGGAFLLFEDELEAGKVTPLHRHPDADETFYLLEGDILLHVDGEQREVHAGGVAMIPRGVPHAFMVTSAHARMLCLQTPGHGERFFRLAGDPVVEGAPRTPVDFDRVGAAAVETGAVDIIGPPPFHP